MDLFDKHSDIGLDGRPEDFLGVEKAGQDWGLSL